MSNVDLTALPESFPAGTTVGYTKSLGDYPASDGWTLTLYLAGVSVTSVEATADGDSFIVTIPASKTLASTGFEPGLYKWIERVALSGAVHEIDSGIVTILPDLATAAAGAEQNWIERAVIALRLHIEGRLPAGMESYAIAGRQVAKMSIKDAVDLLSTLESRLARLQDPSSISRTVLARFTPTGYTS